MTFVVAGKPLLQFQFANVSGPVGAAFQPRRIQTGHLQYQ